MTEWQQVGQVVEAVTGLGFYTVCYVVGGRRWKPVRRLLGGTILAATCALLAWQSWVWSRWMWAGFLSYPTALACGYSGNSTLRKFYRRLTYGMALGLAGAPFLLPLGAWETLLVQLCFSVAISVWAGIRNKTSAVGEEGWVAIGSVFLVPFALIR